MRVSSVRVKGLFDSVTFQTKQISFFQSLFYLGNYSYLVVLKSESSKEFVKKCSDKEQEV